MRFIVEFDGVVANIREVHYAVYRDVAEEVGWSRVDIATFWRQTRRQGTQADVLPGARLSLRTELLRRFAQRIEETDEIAKYTTQPGFEQMIASMSRDGDVALVTLGANRPARSAWLAKIGWASLAERFETLSDDPRRRGVELRVLASGEPRTVVVASSDAIVRAAGSAGLFSIGISCGACTPARLHQAGADVVYTVPDGLTTSLGSGAEDLIRAGLLPAPLT